MKSNEDQYMKIHTNNGKLNRLVNVLFAVFLIGCQSGTESDTGSPGIITLDIKVVEAGNNPLDEIVSHVSFLKLETTEESLIGRIANLQFHNDDIFVLNEGGNGPNLTELLRYNKQGQFLNKIGCDGRGPEEIINPRDFIFTDGYIDVWSMLNISRFTLEGRFVEKVFNAHVPGSGFIKSGNDYLLFHGPAPSHIFTKRNPKGDVIESFKPYNYQVEMATEGDGVIRFDNAIKFYSSSYDTVFSYIDDKIYPSVVFKYVNFDSPFEAAKTATNAYDLFKASTAGLKIIKYFENRDLIFMIYSLKRDRFYLLYDKIGKRSYYFTGFSKSMKHEMAFNSKVPVCLTDDKKLVFSYNYRELTNDLFLQSFQIPKMAPEDNPMLVMYSLQIPGK